jgi:hypothetical protein
MKVLIAAAALILGMLCPAASAAAQAASPPGACIVRFSALLDSATAIAYSVGGPVLSPVYVLAARDCPAPGSGLDEYATEWTPGGVTSRAGLSGSEGKTPKHAAGKRMVAAFGGWMSGRKVNEKVAVIRNVGQMIVLPATPFNRERYAKDVGSKTYFVEKGPAGAKQIVAANAKWSAVQGACLDYAPGGVTPIEVLGRENCTVWIR